MQLSSTLCKSATYSINQSLEVAKGKVEIILIITGWVKKPSVSYKISQPSNNTRWVKKTLWTTKLSRPIWPNYQEPLVSHKTSQPSNNTRWVKKHSEQPNYQEPSDHTTKNL